MCVSFFLRILIWITIIGEDGRNEVFGVKSVISGYIYGVGIWHRLNINNLSISFQYTPSILDNYSYLLGNKNNVFNETTHLSYMIL